MNLYEQLDKKLKTLSKTNILFDSNKIKTQEDIQIVKKILDKTGVVFITNAIKNLATINNKVVECCKSMYFDNMPTKDKNALNTINSLNSLRNPGNGFGNASFGYFFKQPACKEDTLKIELGGEDVYMTNNLAYKLNIELLTEKENRHTLAILLALTHKSDMMVSWDSLKVASNPKPKPKTMTKQLLTKPHFDNYEPDIDRYQAIIAIESSIKLGYIPNSIDTKVKNLISGIVGNKDLYTNKGFIPQDNLELIDIFNKYVVAPPSNCLAIWKGPVIHYEAQFENNIDKINKFISNSNLSNELRIRFCVGTHKICDLDQAEVKELARLAEYGYIPEVYENYNKDNRVFKNIVSRKNTQYKVWRKITHLDKEKFKNIIENKEKYTIENLEPIKKFLYGIKINSDELGFTDEDQKLLI